VGEPSCGLTHLFGPGSKTVQNISQNEESQKGVGAALRGRGVRGDGEEHWYWTSVGAPGRHRGGNIFNNNELKEGTSRKVKHGRKVNMCHQRGSTMEKEKSWRGSIEGSLS